MLPFNAHLSRKRVKNINLAIDKQGNINISAPIKCPLAYIQQFLQKKQNWIREHQERIRLSISHAASLQSGEQHLFLGQPYSLRVHENAEHHGVVLEDSHLCCYVKSVASQEVKQELIRNWQREQLQSLLPGLIQKWKTIIGVQVDQCIIRPMKTRWGSCNTRKNRICLNLHLIEWPIVCIEYELVHELVHLLEASHNQRFYALMNQFMPEWKEHRRLLKNNVQHF